VVAASLDYLGAVDRQSIARAERRRQALEALEFERARAAVRSTGRADLLARLELMRCAERVASLEPPHCPAYQALSDDAGAAERAYAQYLAGRVEPADVAWLPEPQRLLARRIAQREATGDVEALLEIGDPLSRLVGAGVLLHAGRAAPGVVAPAVETASAQGWRRPLLAWLEVQASQFDAAGAAADGARVRRQIALIRGRPAAIP
jgi:hypothetical protein